jgi:UDP-glucose 4-epimerase
VSRVLITGAAGFIGSHLGDSLLGQGHAVIGVDNYLTGNNHRDFVVYKADVTDRHLLYQIANEFEPSLVIHCAASYSDPNLWHRDAETNVLGTINATLVAKHHGARLFYFNTALPPISSYAISKIAGGQYIDQFPAREHLRATEPVGADPDVLQTPHGR